MAESLRLLVISATEGLRLAVSEAARGSLTVATASRASAAIRFFDAETPDLVVVDVGVQPEQAALTVQALRERPLGALVPIFLVDTAGVRHLLATPSGAREAGADRFFPSSASAAAIVHAVAEALSVDLGLPDLEDDEGVVAPQAPSDDLGVAIHSQLADIEGEMAAPRHATVLTDAVGQTPQGPVGAEALRRKVRQVRHEDYFTLLEVRKSADEHTITQAYRKLRRRYDPASVPRRVVDRYHREVREICDALDDAYGVLGAEPLRTEYLKALLKT